MAQSETMKAWRMPAFNEDPTKAVDSLRLEEDVPAPTPKEGQLLIKVAWSSINPIDWKLFTGGYQDKGAPIDRFPYTPGFDVAGTVLVSALGFNIGDHVVANTGLLESCKDPAPLPQGPAGAFATLCVVPADACVKVPESVSLKSVAGLPLTGVTSYQAMFASDMSSMTGEALGDLGPGKKVLILGGAGGTGALAVQLAKSKGVFVATTASPNPIKEGSDVTKLDLVEALGADVVIDYTKDDWGEVLNNAKYDMIYDTVGIKEDLAKRAPKVLKKGGLFVSIANFGDKAPSEDVKYACFIAKARKDHLQKLVDMVEKGDLVVPTDSEYEMDDIPKALKHSIDSHATGKILVKM